MHQHTEREHLLLIMTTEAMVIQKNVGRPKCCMQQPAHNDDTPLTLHTRVVR